MKPVLPRKSLGQSIPFGLLLLVVCLSVVGLMTWQSTVLP
jgi:hypothetical protein